MLYLFWPVKKNGFKRKLSVNCQKPYQEKVSRTQNCLQLNINRRSVKAPAVCLLVSPTTQYKLVFYFFFFCGNAMMVVLYLFVTVDKYRENTETNHVFISWCFWIFKQNVRRTSLRTGHEYKFAWLKNEFLNESNVELWYFVDEYTFTAIVSTLSIFSEL